MEAVDDKNRFIACSDILSLVLLVFALLVADIDPRRHVWGRSKLRRFLIIFAIGINVIFSSFRLIFECIRIDTGPREFLLASVVYCSRWIWLYVDINGPRPRKAFEVARHLKNLKMIRLGTSTRKPVPKVGTQLAGPSERLRALALRIMNWRRASEPTAEAPMEQGSETGDGRTGQRELVIRKGARSLPQHGTPYWRGVEESVETYKSKTDQHTLHFARLVERDLHSSVLDVIGTYEYKKSLDVEGPDGLYRKFYELVMTCDFQVPDLPVDYKHFLDEYSAIAAFTTLPKRTGATSETPLGDVARRIAADACKYVTSDKEVLKTGLHVERLNECIEDAARTFLSTYTRGRNSVSDGGGENIDRDSNV